MCYEGSRNMRSGGRWLLLGPGPIAKPSLPYHPKASQFQYIGIQSELLLQSMPRYDHIITNKSYSAHLAKKQLQTFPQRPFLATMVSALGSLYETVQTTTAQLRDFYASADSPPLDTIPEVSGTKSSLDIASKTMTILAAVNTIEEYSRSPQGREIASAILKRSSGLPTSVKERLEKMTLG